MRWLGRRRSCSRSRPNRGWPERRHFFDFRRSTSPRCPGNQSIRIAEENDHAAILAPEEGRRTESSRLILRVHSLSLAPKALRHLVNVKIIANLVGPELEALADVVAMVNGVDSTRTFLNLDRPRVGCESGPKFDDSPSAEADETADGSVLTITSRTGSSTGGGTAAVGGGFLLLLPLGEVLRVKKSN